MNIYIELEVYNREIESKILLAINSLKKGLKVFIGQRSIIRKGSCWKFAPGHSYEGC